VYVRAVILERFERLAAIRGDAQHGLPTSAWAANLDDIDRDQLVRAVIEVVRALVLPEWESKRPDDRRPQLALEAAAAWVASKSADALAQAKATAKDCTAARNETFGYDHRIPEAARALAWAAGAKDNAHIWEALSAVEEELLARVTLVAEYHRIPEQRRAILAVLKRVLAPPPEAPPPSNDPVPYAASGAFSVGQKLTHPKFGDLTVVAAGNLSRQEKFIARNAMLWDALYVVEQQAGRGDGIAWQSGPDLGLEEGIHFFWHLQRRGRADLGIQLLDGVGQVQLRPEVPTGAPPPTFVLTGPRDTPALQGAWTVTERFSRSFRFGLRQFDCLVWRRSGG